MDEVAISVKSLNKEFLLPHEKNNTVKGLFTGILKRNKFTKETQKALIDINFKVYKGEFFGIVGRNGSGKSTLLKILASIYSPSSGEVKVEGKLVPFIELGVGFNPELSGRDNVYLNGAMLGFSNKEIEAMYDDIVRFAELEDFMDQKLKNYSSGMYVRLAFSMATRSKADILLVDEVLAVGDAEFQRKCYNYFKKLKKDKKTVIFVTHDMHAVKEYCDRVILIEDSRIELEGNANVVSEAYTKMFNEDDITSDIQTTEKKWGDGRVVIESVMTDKKKLVDDDGEIRLTTKIKSKVDITNLRYEFVVTDGEGINLLGLNSDLIDGKIDIQKNQSVILEAVIPNIFSEGVYSLNITISADEKICEQRNDALKFTVFKKNGKQFLTTPPITLKISNAKK
jgi:ABC-2 type transport system ATP-binding protein